MSVYILEIKLNKASEWELGGVYSTDRKAHDALLDVQLQADVYDWSIVSFPVDQPCVF